VPLSETKVKGKDQALSLFGMDAPEERPATQA
jgi:hypothetical protein